MAGDPDIPQLSVTGCPGVTDAGIALKLVITGALPAVTITVAVEAPKLLVAVSV